MANFKGYAIAVGKMNLVMAVTEKGLVGCGFFDILAFDKYGLAAAKVTGVASVDDLLRAEIKAVNKKAEELGVKVGMTGKAALLLF